MAEILNLNQPPGSVWSIRFDSTQAANRFALGHSPDAFWDLFVELSELLEVYEFKVFAGSKAIGRLKSYNLIPLD